jgi:hypothetical protein
MVFEPIAGLIDSNVGKGTVILYSSHSTLRRDCDLGALLRAAGHDVFCQTHYCAELGYDKVVMKQFFDDHAFPTPRWGIGSVPRGMSNLTCEDSRIVIKNRHGTQSKDMRLLSNGPAPSTEEFCELFVEGVEYSVLAFGDSSRHVIFPPVWKGPSTSELTPPWLRMRLCPNPYLAPDIEDQLRSMTLAIARAARGWGFIEAEYIVSGMNEIWVLEINPRISGTMRISAMATGVPIFSIHANESLSGNVVATQCAMEVPYEGGPLTCPELDVFATSRLTVSAQDSSGLQKKIERLCGVSLPPLDSPRSLSEWSSCIDRLRAH